MDNRRKLSVFRNEGNWLSEIAFLYFNFQLNYTAYDYSKDAWQVDKGIDLVVLNKQFLPYYVLTYGNDYPYDYLFLSLEEDGGPSRLLTSESDFVFFYNLGQKQVYIIDLPLLQETLSYQLKNGEWSNIKKVVKPDSVGINISIEDKILKPILGIYRMQEDLHEKAVRIENYLIKQKPLSDKRLPIRRLMVSHPQSS